MPLHPYLAAIKRNLPGVARDLGFQARVTSGFRSYAAQAKLYNLYLQGLNRYPAAPPGTSDHEKGLALDVVTTDLDQLVALLTDAGLSWAGPVDEVHFSLKTQPEPSYSVSEDVPVDDSGGLHAGSPVLGGLFTLSSEPTGFEKVILGIENFLTGGLGY